MNVLGLHFGHDGGVTVVRDGLPVVVLLTERLSRLKHARGLDESMVNDALRAAGIGVGDVDFCAITTTQTFPLLFAHEQSLRVRFMRHPEDRIPSVAEGHVSGQGHTLAMSREDGARKLEKVRNAWGNTGPFESRLEIHNTPGHRLIAAFAPEFLPRPKQVLAKHSLAGLRDIALEPRHVDAGNRYWLHYPATVTLGERKIPAAYVDHHAAHAASSFYQSGLKTALIVTNDGADRLDMSCGAYLAIDNAIVPLPLPRLWSGSFYDSVAARIYAGCDAGKMMGLAPYGRPAFFAERFVGTGSELGFDYGNKLADAWIAETLARAAASHDLAPLGDRAQSLAAINADLAASAHQTFEENVLATIAALKSAAERAANLLGRTIEGLCLSGGCALSCPTNTRAALAGDFARVFVEPSCDDSGLCLGGALWAYHNLLDRPLVERAADYPLTPYLGPTYGKDAVDAAIVAQGAGLRVESPGHAPAAAAEDLAADRVIGWYEGRSEIGPRALGHRSILSDARRKENWLRVNRVKSREAWRPFAPAVLQDDAAKWFKNMPLPSPYMLFTGDVIDPAALPAISHVDGTARVQTVTQDCGAFCDVLRSFRDLTQCSVVMNTSLNGPGEPIVETPEDALRFFRASELDALYLDGLRITKA